MTYSQQQRSLHIKEIILLLLVVLLIGLVIYNRTQQDAFGLLSSEQQQQNQLIQKPVITDFNTEIFIAPETIGLHALEASGEQTPQVSGTVVDPTVPAPVEDVDALNTHVGNEVLLQWVRPASVDAVRVYRSSTKEEGEQVVVDASTNLSFIDTDLENDTQYTYRFVSLNTIDGEEYLATDSPIATVTPADTIAPSMPQQLTVESTDETGTGDKGLEISWIRSNDEDADHVTIYRSMIQNIQGVEIASIQQDEPPRYIDTDIEPNVPYYYTVIAYDTAGNASGSTVVLPQQGNSNPFATPPQPQEDNATQ